MKKRLLNVLQSRSFSSIIGLLVAIYGYIEHWGPFRWLAWLQLKVLGLYYPSATLFLTLYFVFLLTSVLARRFFSSEIHSMGQALNSLRSESASDQRAHNFNRAVLNLKLGLIGVVGIASLVFAIWQLVEASNMGSLQNIQLGALESDPANAPKGRWWQFTGVLLSSETRRMKIGETFYYFTPVVSNTWSERHPVRVLVFGSKNRFEKDEKTAAVIDGVLARPKIAADLQANWDSAQAPLHDRIFVLHYEDSPKARFLIAKKALVVAALIAFVSLAFFLLRRRQDSGR